MLIHLEKLGKTFGEKVVLHDVTASVEREDRIGIGDKTVQAKPPCSRSLPANIRTTRASSA